MKIRSILFAAFPLLLCTAVQAQTSTTPPPIKMGLWQYEVTTTGGPGGPGSGTHTTVTQSCLTPDTWTQGFRNSRQQSAQCTTSNMHQTQHNVSFDVSCSQQDFTFATHVEMSLESDSEMHGTTTTKMSGPRFPGMTMTSAVHSKFLNTDCGGIQPGKSKLVSMQ